MIPNKSHISFLFFGKCIAKNFGIMTKLILQLNKLVGGIQKTVIWFSGMAGYTLGPWETFL